MSIESGPCSELRKEVTLNFTTKMKRSWKHGRKICWNAIEGFLLPTFQRFSSIAFVCRKNVGAMTPAEGRRCRFDDDACLLSLPPSFPPRSQIGRAALLFTKLSFAVSQSRNPANWCVCVWVCVGRARIVCECARACVARASVSLAW